VIYPADINRQYPIGWTISFPDFPDTGGRTETHEDALDGARDALVTAVEFCIPAHSFVTEPSELQIWQYAIELPPNVAARVRASNRLLISAMLKEG
jgi:predicted RNase H-like HicB family nuclease